MLSKLHSLRLDAPLDLSGESLVFVELVVPRPAIARRSTLKPVQLRRGGRTFARQPLYETALLKERVDGPFGLKVAVTRPGKHPEWRRLFRQLLAEGAKSLGDVGFSGFDLLDDIAEEAFDQLADRIGEDAPVFAAAGGLDLDSETLESGRLTLPLHLTRSIRSSAHLPLSERREKRKSQAKTFRKGLRVGEVVVEIGG